jgi:hypothetical protein
VEADAPFSAVNGAGRRFEKARSKAGLPAWPIVRISVVTDEEFEFDLARPTFPELVGIREITALLEVTPQRASTLCRSAAFPTPIVELRVGPVWTADSVRLFIEEWKRQPGRPRLRQATA